MADDGECFGIMTEDEMKTKWCPHVRVNDDGQEIENRFNEAVKDPDTGRWGLTDELSPHCCCIGSACSQFRRLDIDRGCYCGLAGKP